jgi:hypothetical protein
MPDYSRRPPPSIIYDENLGSTGEEKEVSFLRPGYPSPAL